MCIRDSFFTFFDVVKSPLAIRSSSLLEDSYYQPFAGIYNTYMIPYLDDKYEMLRMLSDAIKGCLLYTSPMPVSFTSIVHFFLAVFTSIWMTPFSVYFKALESRLSMI